MSDKRKDVSSSLGEKGDAWVNGQSGFGNSYDPVARSTFNISSCLDRTTIETLFRYDWLTRRIISIIAADAIRKFVDINAENEEIVRFLNKKCRHFKIRKKFREALMLARLYGGSVIIIGVRGAGSPERKLNYDNIDEIAYFNVLDRHAIEIEKTYQNPLKDNYGEPEIYRLTTFSAGESAVQKYGRRIHESRVIKFNGEFLPELTKRNNNYWDDSVLQGINLSLKQYGISLQSAAVLFQDFISKVLKLPNLAELLSSDEGVQALDLRIQYAIGNLSSLGICLIGEDEEYTKMQTPVAGLADLISINIEIASACSSIPRTRLFGQSLGTLAGATETTRTYYDNICSYQDEEVAPGLERILRMFLKSKDSITKGEEPEWDFEFKSLWSETDKEITTSRKMQAQTDQIYIENRVLTPNEVAKNRFRPDGYSFGTNIDLNNREGEFLEKKEEVEKIEKKEESVDINNKNNEKNNDNKNNKLPEQK